jgi:hypothetical protein
VVTGLPAGDRQSRCRRRLQAINNGFMHPPYASTSTEATRRFWLAMALSLPPFSWRLALKTTTCHHEHYSNNSCVLGGFEKQKTPT